MVSRRFKTHENELTAAILKHYPHYLSTGKFKRKQSLFVKNFTHTMFNHFHRQRKAVKTSSTTSIEAIEQM